MFFYLFLRSVEWFIGLFSYRTLHAIGRVLGTLIYYLHGPFRKKAMTNLAIAFGKDKSYAERRHIAIKSFQNLCITCLEFFRLKKSKNKMEELVIVEKGEEVLDLLNKKQGVIFLTGHQANWEVPFIAVTSFAKGIAIGRPIKNKRLYDFVLSVREMNGGTIVMPKRAIAESTAALKAGKFVGIVGDQAFPESSYSYPLFGTRAWTTTTPALLAYKTNSPLVVAMTKRHKGRYIVQPSPIIWPDTTKPLKEEVVGMMNQALGYLEKSIATRPGDWLWQHDRWKQSGTNNVKRKYRFSFILVILTEASKPLVEAIEKIYPRAFITYLIPPEMKLEGKQTIIYNSEDELCVDDWRYQMLIDFYDSAKARRFFRKRGVFKALTFKNFDAENIRKTLIKPECL